jgi:hypothetical protein
LYSRLLIEDLAASPPQVWERRAQQFEVISALATKQRLCAAEIAYVQEALGVSRSRVFQLLRLHRARLASRKPRGHDTGCRFRVSKEREDIIARAIAYAGPSARAANVHAISVELSKQAGVEPPCERTVRTRFGRFRLPVNLVKRFDLDCDVVADLSPLALNLGSSGTDRPAWLLSLYDSGKAELISHHLFAGQTDRSQLVAALSEAMTDARGPDKYARLGLTPLLADYGIVGLNFLDGTRTVAASPSQRPLAGAVTRAVLGRHIGKIQVRTEINEAGSDSLPAVSKSLAEIVLNHLLTPETRVPPAVWTLRTSL